MGARSRSLSGRSQTASVEPSTLRACGARPSGFTPESVEDGSIGGRPWQRIEVGGGDPAGLGVFAENEASAGDPREERNEAYAHFGVFVENRCQRPVDGDGHGQLLADFTDEGFLGGLSGVDLSSGELPESGKHFSRRTSRCEVAVLFITDDRADDVDGIVGHGGFSEGSTGRGATSNGFIAGNGVSGLGYGLDPANPQLLHMNRNLRVSGNGRFLEWTQDEPFFWMGDTAWELFHRLDPADSERYLKNRAAKGFTVIQAVILAELDGLDVPNAGGHPPLLDSDPTRPCEGFFTHVDAVVARGNDLGLVMGMLPTWGRYWADRSDGSDPVFNPENARAYGRFVGARYRDASVVWILGGDRWVADDRARSVIEAMAAGLREGDGGRHPITFHPRGPGRSSEDFHDAEWLDFNMGQTSHAARDHDTGLSTASDYARTPVKPTLDGEPRYEGIPVGFYLRGASPLVRIDAADVRKAAWWSLLAGACGHTYGHNSVWQMWEPGRKPIISANIPWYAALDHPGAFQMGVLARLWTSRPWTELEPGDSWLLDAPMAGPSKVRGMIARDGSWAMVYSSEGASFAIDLTRFAATQLDEVWFDPRTGVLERQHTSANAAFQTFVPPTSGRGEDWVLLLEDPDRGFPRQIFDEGRTVNEEHEVDRPADW